EQSHLVGRTGFRERGRSFAFSGDSDGGCCAWNSGEQGPKWPGDAGRHVAGNDGIDAGAKAGIRAVDRSGNPGPAARGGSRWAQRRWTNGADEQVEWRDL